MILILLIFNYILIFNLRKPLFGINALKIQAEYNFASVKWFTKNFTKFHSVQWQCLIKHCLLKMISLIDLIYFLFFYINICHAWETWTKYLKIFWALKLLTLIPPWTPCSLKSLATYSPLPFITVLFDVWPTFSKSWIRPWFEVNLENCSFGNSSFEKLPIWKMPFEVFERELCGKYL